MKKSLVALAIAGAFVAPVAMADSNVVVYGVANVSVDVTNFRSGTTLQNGVIPVTGFTSNKVSSNTSRLGFKGNEDLGNGLSAIWQVESLISLDNAGGTFATRNTYGGLTGGFGTVLAGRHDTPYNIATRRLDLFSDTIADNRSIMGGGRALAANTLTAAAIGTATVGAGFDGRQPDVIAYITPNLGGFTGAIGYVAGAEGQTTSIQTKGSALSVAGWYAADALYASLAYEQHHLGNAPGTIGNTAIPALTSLTESAVKGSVSYKFIDALTLSLAYERTKDDFGALGQNVLGHNAGYFAAKYAFDNSAVKFAYTQAGATQRVPGANDGAKQYSLGYDHGFTKRTTLYAQYTSLNNNRNGVYTTFGQANATGSLSNLTLAQTGYGAKLSAFSLGLKHSF